MIRMAVPEDAAGCLSIYNWYIENSDATFESSEATPIFPPSIPVRHTAGHAILRSIRTGKCAAGESDHC